MPASATVVVVAYATRSLHLSWLPSDAPMVIVHNDELLDDASLVHPGLRHIHPGRNLGFGAAVNLAVASVETERVVLVNPDVVLTAAHWDALDAGLDDEVRTVPLVDADGSPTSVVSGYPTPLSHLVSGYRLGRFAARGSRLRRVATRLLGRWGDAHTASLEHPTGEWPLSDRWVSGAVMSLAVARFEAVGGFDPRYFLYYEDVDLCERLARTFPPMRAVVVDTPPGRHAVGGSDTAADGRDSPVEGHRLTSAINYSRRRTSVGWRLSSTVLESRDRWRNR